MKLLMAGRDEIASCHFKINLYRKQRRQVFMVPKKIFSKTTLKITGITYILIALIFFIGYITHTSGGIPNFGPIFSGMALSLIFVPFIFISGIIYIIVKKQGVKHVLIGYLILTIGVGSISIGVLIIIESRREAASIQQWREATQKNIDFIQNSIGNDVWSVFPNAEFYMENQFGSATTRRAVIKLGGFSFENQPDFDAEITKWREIARSLSFINFPYRISVRYYFENAWNSFASIELRDFSLHYRPLGMTEDAFAYLTPLLKEYLRSFHDDFSIFTNWRFDVRIYKELNSEDELNEEVMWQNFVKLHNINIELVEIQVTYIIRDSFTGGRSYNISQQRWFGNQ